MKRVLFSVTLFLSFLLLIKPLSAQEEVKKAPWEISDSVVPPVFSPDKKRFYLVYKGRNDDHGVVIYRKEGSKNILEWYWGGFDRDDFEKRVSFNDLAWKDNKTIDLILKSDSAEEQRTELVLKNGKWLFPNNQRCHNESRLCSKKEDELIQKYPNVFSRINDALVIIFPDRTRHYIYDRHTQGDDASSFTLTQYYPNLQLSLINYGGWEWNSLFLIDHISKKVFGDIQGKVAISPEGNQLSIMNQSNDYEDDLNKIYILKQTQTGLSKELEFLPKISSYELTNLEWINENKLSFCLVDKRDYSYSFDPKKSKVPFKTGYIEKINTKWIVYTKDRCFINQCDYDQKTCFEGEIKDLETDNYITYFD